MSLRLIQVILPRRHRDEMAVILAEADPPQSWTAELGHDFQMTTILVRAAAVEALSDTLTEQFSALDGYRLVILPVQASLPKVPEPEPEPKDNGDEPGNGHGHGNGNGSGGENGKPKWKPLIGRVSREELDEAISRSGKPDGLYIAMTVLATVVATVGLIKNSPAVIIGAMVIAPLLGPNMALALGTTLGDWRTIRRCTITNILGITIVGTLTVLTGLVTGPDPMIPEIATRTTVDVGDVMLALASGAAGALAFTAGAHATVVGVMVAVALLPPTVVCGLMLGAGEWRAGLGAGVMLVVNVVSVNLAATLVFLIQGIRPDQWWQADRAGRSVRLSMVIWIGLLALLVVLLLTGTLDAPEPTPEPTPEPMPPPEPLAESQAESQAQSLAESQAQTPAMPEPGLPSAGRTSAVQPSAGHQLSSSSWS